jgi:4'-phosphopantetheinyl transferase
MSLMNLFWLECSAADLPARQDWLTAWESTRFREFRFAKRRADWLLGRWTAKCAIAANLGSGVSIPIFRQIEIRPDESGAPQAFLDNLPVKMAVSISHRDGRALVAVAPANASMGCDLEIVELRTDAFVRDFFTEEEVTKVQSCHEAEARQVVVSLIWSGKESALKALHTGLRMDTRSLSVQYAFESVSGTPWKQLRVIGLDGKSFEGWWLRSGAWLRTIVTSQRSGAPILTRMSS